MSIAVELPALGESVVEGTVSKWLVKEGDRVEVDEPLVEVTTDKVDAEIPAPASGVVEQLLVSEGETLAVGQPLLLLATVAETFAPTAAAEPARAREPGHPAFLHYALSYDHRAVDGAPANGFLFRVRQLLEEAEFDL